MKISFRFAIALIIISTVISCNKASEEKAPKQYTIRQFMDIVSLNGRAFSPDETKVLISANETGIFNAEEINLSTGEKKVLTASSTNAIFALSYFPGDERMGW